MTGTSHQWRIPTKADWILADVDGIRKVLPNMDHSFWSASSYSYVVYNAWVFSGDSGYGGYFGRNSPLVAARCVGR
jgi:hypothetical protein